MTEQLVFRIAGNLVTSGDISFPFWDKNHRISLQLSPQFYQLVARVVHIGFRRIVKLFDVSNKMKKIHNSEYVSLLYSFTLFALLANYYCTITH